MTTERYEGEVEGFHVLVEFKSSSTKDGKEGYRVVVTDGAEMERAQKAQEIAEELRGRCIELIERTTNDKAMAGFSAKATTPEALREKEAADAAV